MVHLAREGGAEHICFLLALRATETHFLPKTFKDVAKLQADSKKRWLEFCLEELKSLKDRDVYEIMDLLKGRKAVKNCWVFNIKPDGQLRYFYSFLCRRWSLGCPGKNIQQNPTRAY